MAKEFTENYGSVVMAGLIISIILAAIVYLIG